jgi:hypothetical protein
VEKDEEAEEFEAKVAAFFQGKEVYQQEQISIKVSASNY